MEFLDPKNQRSHTIRLFIGYILIATALILTTIILLYQAYGFGLKNGNVIQSGLIFMSSNPNPADIYINGQKREENTNVRLLMPAGQYTFELKRDGYTSWKRAVNIQGGTVARFDYPFLFPTTPVSTNVKRYDGKPTLATQSPDRRWVLVQAAAAFNTFDIFDLTKPDKPPVAVTLPESLSALNGTHSWKFIEWSNDNAHVLLQHQTETNGKLASEYILVDRESPEKSVNITNALGVNPTTLTLQDKKYDKYFLYTQEDKKLFSASLSNPKPVALLDHVLHFKTYGNGIIAYATDKGASEGKIAIKLQDGTKTYMLRQVAPASTYMIDIARYDGDWYVAAGSPAENRTYVFKNPMSVLSASPKQPLVPVQVLKTANPTYISFSENARFIMVENGQQFSVYDAETQKGYTYALDLPLDTPQQHAEWMDGHRLSYISGGKTVVFDYDHTNQEMLAAADPAYQVFFGRDYKFLYNFIAQPAKAADGKDITQAVLTSTSLRTAKDQ